ncbi:MAG: hypothetical protein K6A75_10015 [Ruminococcus sp.]|nr:hypothetical protein [Ruminococcus sp.]
MKKLFTAVMAVLLAGAVMTAVSCGGKDSSSSSSGVRVDGGDTARKNMTDEEYHSTYMSNDDLKPADDSNVSIQISYDNNYWNDSTGYDELYAVNDYVEALNSGDFKAIADCYYPGFLEGVCKESEQFTSAEQFVEEYYATLEGALCEGFKINFIEISDCRLAGDAEADSRFEMRDENLKTVFGDDIISKISDRKLLTMGGYTYYGSEDTNYITELTNVLPEGMLFCVYTIDGKPYIF